MVSDVGRLRPDPVVDATLTGIALSLSSHPLPAVGKPPSRRVSIAASARSTHWPWRPLKEITYRVHGRPYRVRRGSIQTGNADFDVYPCIFICYAGSLKTPPPNVLNRHARTSIVHSVRGPNHRTIRTVTGTSYFVKNVVLLKSLNLKTINNTTTSRFKKKKRFTKTSVCRTIVYDCWVKRNFLQQP